MDERVIEEDYKAGETNDEMKADVSEVESETTDLGDKSQDIAFMDEKSKTEADLPEDSADENQLKTSLKEEIKAEVKEELKKERRKNLMEFLMDIVISVALAAIVLTFIKPIVIQQESMLDTYLPGDYVILSRQAYHLFGEPERGDVIVFKTDMETDDGKTKNLIKRVIGLPGERVEVRDDGYVYIDGEKLEESYVREQGISDWISGPVDLVVGENELFVCGDNREVSLDSRIIGCIDQDTIMGKVKCRLFNIEGNRR